MDTAGDVLIEVRVNCASEDEAAAIASAVVGRGLAGAANILPAITSIYRWKGEVRTSAEVPLLLKTLERQFRPLAELIGEMHSYETPSITAVRLEFVSRSYREWMGQVLEG